MPENNKRTAAAASKDALDVVKQKARDLTAGAADAAGAAKDKAMEWSSAAADKAGDALQDLGKELTKVVRRYPLQSVLAGLVVGFLLARKMKS